jgi:hypothetical protein
MKTYICNGCSSIYGVELPPCPCCERDELSLVACGFCESDNIAEVQESDAQYYLREGYTTPAEL